MNIETAFVLGLPVVVIDDYYDDQAVEKIWREIEFYSSQNCLKTAEHTGSATSISSDGSISFLEKNKGIYLDEIYRDRKVSSILTENRKTFSQLITQQLVDIHAIFRYLQNVDKDCTLLSYYENSDYYKPHTDNSVITIVSWFYKEPKNFQGGVLQIENQLEIQCLFNRTVIFPSMLQHAVTPVTIADEHLGKNFGRYTLTQLVSYRMNE